MRLRRSIRLQSRSSRCKRDSNNSSEPSPPSTHATLLPIELLLMTFKELDKSDLKSIRLVSPLWNNIASELLFDRIWISHRQKDIEVFNAWTANKRCSSFVKALIYDASYLDHKIDRPGYAQHLCEQLDDVHPLKPQERDYTNCDPKIQEFFFFLWGGRKLNKREQKKTVKELFESGRFNKDGEHWFNLRKSSKSRVWGFPVLREGYDEYLKEAALEADMRASGELCVHLTRGLERLPRLQSITFWDRAHLYGVHKVSQFDPLLPKPIYLSGPPFVRSWNPLHALPNNILESQLIDPRRSEATFPTRDTLAKAFETLLSAIALSRVKVARMEIAGNQFHFEPVQGDSERNTYLSRNVRTVFANLESFSVHVTMSCLNPERERFYGLSSALSAGANLSYLNLKGSRSLSPYWPPSKCVFASLLPCTSTLTKLRTFKLHKFSFKAKNLLSFLLRHKLIDLELCYDTILVTGDDHAADVRSTCNAVSSLPKFMIAGVETKPANGATEDKYLIVEMHTSTTAPIVKLRKKGIHGDSDAGRVVDLKDAWHVMQQIASIVITL